MCSVQLKEGEKLLLYTDWQEETKPEGIAKLVEFVRHTDNFLSGEDDEEFKGERWNVEFDNGFSTTRNIRVSLSGKSKDPAVNIMAFISHAAQMSPRHQVIKHGLTYTKDIVIEEALRDYFKIIESQK